VDLGRRRRCQGDGHRRPISLLPVRCPTWPRAQTVSGFASGSQPSLLPHRFPIVRLGALAESQLEDRGGRGLCFSFLSASAVVAGMARRPAAECRRQQPSATAGDPNPKPVQLRPLFPLPLLRPRPLPPLQLPPSPPQTSPPTEPPGNGAKQSTQTKESKHEKSLKALDE